MREARNRRPSDLRLFSAKVVVWVLGLFPLGRWVWLGNTGGLGANPIEFLTRSAGTWTLVFLLVTLAISPLRVILQQPAWLRLRRLFGLFAFFYASLHFLAFVWWDHWFDMRAMLADVAQRPFIAFGFTAFVLLIPLALTSTRGWQRRLGRRWQKLHRLIYLAGALAIVHFWLHRAGKNDFFDVVVYGGVLAALLGWRVWRHIIKR